VNASPVPQVQQAIDEALTSVAGVTDELHQIDLFTLASTGAQNLTLTYLPSDQSWNVSLNGITAKWGTDYTISGQTLSLLTPLDPRTSDILEIQYDYLTGLSALPDTAWVDTVTALGPLAWYRLDDVSNGGTLLDSSGHGHHGTWNGVTTHTFTTSLLPSDPNAALLMTGAPGEGASVPSASWMNLTTNMSWVIFFKSTDTSARLWAREQITGGGQDWSLQFGGQLYFAAGGAVVLTSAASGLNDNNMHMAVFTYDGAHVKLYVDGTLDTSVAYSTALGTAAQDVVIGYGGGITTGHMFAGTLDEAVWFDLVLTSTDVTNLWNAAT
jgi:hypothetical protein